MKILVFGGSFDPPHFGHVFSVAWMLSSEKVDQVWVVPCRDHPFGKDLTPFEDRLEMCNLAFELFGEGVVVDPFGYETERKGSSFSYDLLKFYEKNAAEYCEYILAVGSDVMNEIHQWYKSEEILEKYPIVEIPRGEGGIIPNISSTQIRNLAKQSVLEPGKLVPGKVLRYILDHNLYAGEVLVS